MSFQWNRSPCLAAKQGISWPNRTNHASFMFQRRRDWCAGDLGDLIPALDVEKRPAWEAMDAAEMLSTIHSKGRCSALVKVTGERASKERKQPLPLPWGALSSQGPVQESLFCLPTLASRCGE
jgi:hypothetical protein